MDNLFNRDAEQSILGALMMQSNSFDEIHWMTPSMFYEHVHQIIFSTLTDMITKNQAVDVITVAEHLDAKEKLKAIGGISYLGSLVTNCAGAYNIKRYAEIVQEKHISRMMLEAIETIRADMVSAGDVYKKLEKAQNAIMSISERTDSNEPKFIADLLPERMLRIDDAYQGKIKMLSTGLIDLDTRLGGGIEGGSLVVIAACASMGKTALAIQLAEAFQSKDKASLVFSIEMSNGLIVDRLIANKSRLSSADLRTGNLKEDDFNYLISAVPQLKNINMLLDDKTNKLNGMRSKARTVKRKHGLSCIVIDYIGLMLTDDEDKFNSREQQISTITRGLKALAKELEIPVIALSQLNRKVADRTNKRPLMSDLRDSGAIEQDADVIMLVYRDDYYNSDSEFKGLAEINVAKNRNGATGSVITNFEKERTLFTNYAGGLREIEPKAKRGSQYD
jgi:replicative DNA helicase